MSFVKFLIIPIIALCSLNTLAQSVDTLLINSDIKQQFLVKRLSEELNLSPQQIEAVREIIAVRSNEIQESKSQIVSKQEQIQKANEKAKNKLKDALTDDQYNLFVSLRNDLKEQREAYYAEHKGLHKSDDEELEF